MTSRVRNILDSVWWSENKSSDISDLLMELSSRGFEFPSEQVCQFYKSFLNIDLEFRVDDGSFRHMNFGEQSILDQDEDLIFDLIKSTGIRLYPAGEAEHSAGQLLVGINGEIYVLTDGRLLFVGNDIFSAIDNVAADNHLQLIHPLLNK